MMFIGRQILLISLLLTFVCSNYSTCVVSNKIEETVVNGTELDARTTLYGLITDEDNQVVPDVVVTDGFTCVTTDQNGVYQLVRHEKAKFVYYSTPSDCKIMVDEDNYPKFFEKLTSEDKRIRQDFKVERQPIENEFALFCVADPQCRNEREVKRYRSETIPDINKESEKYDNVYSMTLGDVTFDNINLWDSVKVTMANQSVPFFQTIGNHDHLHTAPNDEMAAEKFQEMFGPTDYSFNRGDVHIISMDNVIYDGKENYSGGFTESQWKWLQEDLSHVSKDNMVILCSHIPFRKGGKHDHIEYHGEVLELLSTFAEAHIMIGHTHYQINYLHEVNDKIIYEHVHGAACGAWWNSDWCVDGTPNGYAVYEIKGNTIENWYYKGTGEEVDFQIRAYDASKHFGPPNKYTYSFAHNMKLTGEGWIVANIWNSDETWDVKLYQDGVEIGPMTRRSSKDYWVLYHHLEELGKKVGTNFDKTSDHFYIGQVSGKASEADFEIEAIDSFGNRYTTSVLHD